MLAKIARLTLGLGLIPAVIGFGVSFYGQLLQIRQVQTPEIIFLLGITGYLAFHALIAPPSRAYVFGHELTHAAATWVSGGQVKGFKAGAKKGAVAVNKVTGLIALAPYLIPVYAVLWALGFGAAGLFWNVKPWAAWFFFGLGAALTFHLVFTVTALKQKQSDLEVLGPVLSLVLILFGNVSLVMAVLGLLIPEVGFGAYWAGGLHRSLELYRAIFTQLFF
ncbi:MAG: hypothetical protein HYS41_02060 [Candidatus Omnitrophica bacterium]|nr:hypothetical protein [Candidatus Omnitrophota bacterium]